MKWVNYDLLNKYIVELIDSNEMNQITNTQIGKCNIERMKIPTSAPSCTQQPRKDCSGLAGFSYGICVGSRQPQPKCNYLAYDTSINAQNNMYEACMRSDDYFYVETASITDYLVKNTQVIKNIRLNEMVPVINGNEYLAGYSENGYFTILRQDIFIDDANIFFNAREYKDYLGLGWSDSILNARVKYGCAEAEFSLVDGSMHSMIDDSNQNISDSPLAATLFTGFLKRTPDKMKMVISGMCVDLSNPKTDSRLNELHYSIVKNTVSDEVFTKQMKLFCNDFYPEATDNACYRYTEASVN